MKCGILGWSISRRLSSDKYINKKVKEKLLHDDDGHWIEAEMDKNINAPEEQYAHEKEMELLKKMAKKIEKEKEEDINKKKDS
ncbi:unnamed protein product [Phytomonas sp. Hart1]|nr:unnamed protein product [Phytomonas sp. Hart1]|eukprot:CCW67609.1 unnamed protein product [Phytomonas sp. isolate Hart1]